MVQFADGVVDHAGPVVIADPPQRVRSDAVAHTRALAGVQTGAGDVCARRLRPCRGPDNRAGLASGLFTQALAG